MSILFTDNFQRANGAIGPNWATIPGNTAFSIASHTAIGSNIADDAVSVNSTVTYPNDQWAQVTVGQIGNVNEAGVGPVVRGSISANTCYFCFCCGVNGADEQLFIFKLVAGTFTQLGLVNVTVVSGDVLYMSAVGTTITVQKNGINVFTGTDTSIAGGFAGMNYSAQDGAVSDSIALFSAGDFNVVPGGYMTNSSYM